MTQTEENIQKIAELNSLFMSLDDRSQDGALTILRSLSFAQSVVDQPREEEPPVRRKGKGSGPDVP